MIFPHNLHFGTPTRKCRAFIPVYACKPPFLVTPRQNQVRSGKKDAHRSGDRSRGVRPAAGREATACKRRRLSSGGQRVEMISPKAKKQRKALDVATRRKSLARMTPARRSKKQTRIAPPAELALKLHSPSKSHSMTHPNPKDWILERCWPMLFYFWLVSRLSWKML